MRRLMLAFASILLMINTGCEKYIIKILPIEDGISFSTQVQPIFDNSCVSCHSGGRDPNLTPEESYDALFDGVYLDTIVPESSTLYVKLRSGAHDGRTTEEEKLTILKWITEGALNN